MAACIMCGPIPDIPVPHAGGARARVRVRNAEHMFTILLLWGQGQGWWHMSCGGIACG